MKLSSLWLVPLIAVPLLASALSAQDADLFSQTASAELKRQFPDHNLSWLLLDRTGRILARNWDNPDEPISPGSLLKPFVAVAYGAQHGFAYPQVTCHGTRDRCWLPRGHGTLGLEKAIADSCNAYFLTLAGDLDPARAQTTFARFGLNGLPSNTNRATFVGLSDQWRETPLTLARAYLALVAETPEPARQRILAGMRLAAESGTARDIDASLGAHAALAKTGTSACSHHPRGAADGFAIVLFPAAQPRVVLLVRMHGATGAHTATQAGAMLHAIGMGTQ